MDFFDHIPLSAPDPIFGLIAAFETDPRPTKVNLSIGVYKTADLRTPVMKAVKRAEERLFRSETNKEYLPIDGDKQYIEQTGQLLFGEELWSASRARIYGAQTVGGTGALRVCGDFLRGEFGDTIHLSDPTWPNHKGVFSRAGFKVAFYPYYNRVKHRLDFEHFYTHLSQLPEKSIILLHACCHNPTGADLTLEQWKALSDLCLEKRFLPFFDCAYQGFGKCLQEDVAGVRLFLKAGHEMLVAYSYAKNFSLYAERAGALFVVARESSREGVTGRIKSLIRTNYSNPPLHGARIVAEVLKTPELRREWDEELREMRERINAMRRAFVLELCSKSGKEEFAFFSHHVGLFSLCGLDRPKIERLIREYGIYMTGDGRINIAGLTPDRLDYVVRAILSVSHS